MTLTVLSIIGTRPEAIKMAPVIRALSFYPSKIRSVVCVTGQHRQMLDQVLDLFQIKPDYDLDLMVANQSLAALTASILLGIEPILDSTKPDWVLVQGDTTTVLAASLTAFYHGLRVGHIEAGLRTKNKRSPFPEEINRRVTSVIADMHFAPTESSRQALLAEGVPESTIHVTGNTVIDTLYWMREVVRHSPPALPKGVADLVSGRRLILVTGHRRENFGPGIEQVCLALLDIVQEHPSICVIFSVHLNPNTRSTVYRMLQGVPRILLIDPLSYAPFVQLMDMSDIIITDSGGIQEEGPALGKPVLVTRDVTERPEGVAAGNAVLVGTTRGRIVAEARRLLTDDGFYTGMATARNPYGDGQAACRIVDLLLASS